jgi:hypothetical protein
VGIEGSIRKLGVVPAKVKREHRVPLSNAANDPLPPRGKPADKVFAVA